MLKNKLNLSVFVKSVLNLLMCNCLSHGVIFIRISTPKNKNFKQNRRIKLIFTSLKRKCLCKQAKLS